MKFQILSSSKKRTPADLLAIGCFQKVKNVKLVESVEPEFLKLLQAATRKERFIGKAGEILSSIQTAYQEAPEIVALGLGDPKKYREISLREAVGKIVQMAKAKKAVRVRILAESFTDGRIKLPDVLEMMTETIMLASYSFDKYKTKKEENLPEIATVEYLLGKKASETVVNQKIAKAQIIANGVNFARNLCNEPGNIMNSITLSQAAKEMARESKLKCQVLGLSELKKLKMGGILAVNQGSKTPPALIVMEYGERHKKKGTVCLVGKGVTFDTGGISIKPSKDMEKMKYDMAGAATVIAAMQTIASLSLPVHVVGLAAVVENMVAENPQRPGDIIRMFNGKTVEVLNTDAEGRLILGDALAYTEKFKPKAIIDFATLTGACAYTFGDKAIGLLGNNQPLLSKIKKAGEVTGERCWELPMWEEYGKVMKGHHSDLYNIGTGGAGTITATMFLKEFVPEKTPWAHLDIAGTAWCDQPRFDCPKGATGVGVRILANLLSNWR